jgi:DMSO/TMAO reductase YedYZ molybdopterin-dependent catalytic subunit
MHSGTMLAYRVNDEILPQEHGFPLRAIVPGMYGQMNPKRITEIEIVDDEYVGYWQRMEQ